MINYQDFDYEGKKITFSIGKDVYVNATKMAKAFNKRPNDWLVLSSTKEFLQALSVTKFSCNTQLVITKRGNCANGSQGTWLHEDVALEFARWLSPMFAIWCNDRIKELLKNGFTQISSNASYSAPAPTTEIIKNDSITTNAARVVGKDFSFSDVARMIIWGNRTLPKRMLLGWMYEHNWLTTHPTGVPYPTEAALAMGLFVVIDRAKRGLRPQLKKPRVRITMDGANYFINTLSHAMKGLPSSYSRRSQINM